MQIDDVLPANLFHGDIYDYFSSNRDGCVPWLYAASAFRVAWIPARQIDSRVDRASRQNDVGGTVAVLWRILESEEWVEFSATLALRFVEFLDAGLIRDASDRVVWQTCQEVGAVLITGNRASGDDSLEQTIRDHAGAHSLPVVTIGDPQRLVRDRAWASECVIRLLDLLERIETLRGTGQLFIP